MKIALVYNAKLPAKLYGGTERVVWWLAKGLKEAGHSVALVCQTGSRCDFADVVTSRKADKLPQNYDVYHHFDSLKDEPSYPYVITIGGNAQPNESFLKNCVFVSENHADRHNAECFVHNGVDPAEYIFRAKKDPYITYLAKTSWRVKNVKGAIEIASLAQTPIKIMGGRRFGWPQRDISWMGMLGGKKKAEVLSHAKALLFPVVWDEPFGLAVVESLMSGTPVLATPFGSLPELVPAHVGFLCRTYPEFISALGQVDSLDAEACRDWAVTHFHYQKMTENYLALYEKVLKGESLNPVAPRGTHRSRPLYALGRT